MASDFEAMLETMAASEQLSGPEAGVVAAGVSPDAPAEERKALPTTDMPIQGQIAADSPTPAQSATETAQPSPTAALTGDLVQPATDKPIASPLAQTKPTPETTQPATDADADTDAARVLLQQIGLPAPAPTLPIPDGQKTAYFGNRLHIGSDTVLRPPAAGAPDQVGSEPAPDLAQPAPAGAPQVTAEAAVPAIPVTAADSAVAGPGGKTDQAMASAVATTLPRPAMPAFQPAAPRPVAPAAAKPDKTPEHNDALLATQTAEPQGIAAPTADKPNLAATVERKADDAPALPHHPAADFKPAAPDGQLTAHDPLLDSATFSGNSSAPAGASGSPAASASAGSTAASAAQSHVQLQQPTPLSGVPVLIASKALAGDKHFDIRLDPPELGRIEVRLKVGREGQISSHLIADRADTLALLRRDEAGLERALQDAGFKTAGDGLQFSLRDQSGNGQADSRPAPQPPAPEEASTRPDVIPSGYTRYSGRVGGLDIRV